jgi:hypothetical protein
MFIPGFRADPAVFAADAGRNCGIVRRKSRHLTPATTGRPSSTDLSEQERSLHDAAGVVKAFPWLLRVLLATGLCALRPPQLMKTPTLCWTESLRRRCVLLGADHVGFCSLVWGLLACVTCQCKL